MGLAAQWDAMIADAPTGWRGLALTLRLARPEDAGRAAALLGPLGPGLAGDDFHLRVTAQGTASPSLVRRLLSLLEEEGIAGTLELVDVEAPAADAVTTDVSGPLAAQWDELEALLPEDWSDLLCLVELRSSDELAPAALALAPLNPSRHERGRGFRFRVARRFGYGAAPQMARRCLARLDEAGIPGTLHPLEVLSDTRPVLTQGPTFVVSDRAV
ncbi:MAG TPA: hypothetical protein VFR32_03690 [Gaiellaceae bacterium]|nr:hypothetical protein [Gaiellaceae bacterium]